MVCRATAKARMMFVRNIILLKFYGGPVIAGEILRPLFRITLRAAQRSIGVAASLHVEGVCEDSQTAQRSCPPYLFDFSQKNRTS